MPIKILLLGPESTGKTTLAKALASHFNTIWVPEFTRQYLENKRRLLQANPPITIHDLMPIVIGQLSLEETLESLGHELLFYDAGTYSNQVYAEHYLGEVPDWLHQLHQKPRYNFCLLTQTDLPWQEDWQREAPERREELYERFKSFLSQREILHSEISGQGENRLKQALQALSPILNRRSAPPQS